MAWWQSGRLGERMSGDWGGAVVGYTLRGGGAHGCRSARALLDTIGGHQPPEFKSPRRGRKKKGRGKPAKRAQPLLTNQPERSPRSG